MNGIRLLIPRLSVHRIATGALLKDCPREAPAEAPEGGRP